MFRFYFKTWVQREWALDCCLVYSHSHGQRYTFLPFTRFPLALQPKKKTTKNPSVVFNPSVVIMRCSWWVIRRAFFVLCFFLKTVLGSCWFQITPRNLTSTFERVSFSLGPRALRNMKLTCASSSHLFCSGDGLVYAIKKCIYLCLLCWFFLFLWCL